MFASFSDQGVLTTFFILFCLLMAIRGFKRSWAAMKDNKLLEKNPEAWKTRRDVEDAAKEKRTRQLGTAATFITRLFLKK